VSLSGGRRKPGPAIVFVNGNLLAIFEPMPEEPSKRFHSAYYLSLLKEKE